MNKSVDELLALLKNNLEPADFLPQFGFHESNLKYIFCWALEKVGLKSYGTEVSLPVYPQAPHLSGPKGKRKAMIDLVVNINGYLIGNFGLLTYEPTEGCLSTLRKPTNVKILSQYLPNLSSSEEDILKFKVWKIFRKDGYKVVSEPKPKHA
jgi:hypothetical protein